MKKKNEGKKTKKKNAHIFKTNAMRKIQSVYLLCVAYLAGSRYVVDRMKYKNNCLDGKLNVCKITTIIIALHACYYLLSDAQCVCLIVFFFYFFLSFFSTYFIHLIHFNIVYSSYFLYYQYTYIPMLFSFPSEWFLFCSFFYVKTGETNREKFYTLFN